MSIAVPPPQLERATSEFLLRHPPFNEMEPAALHRLAESAKLGYYPKGSLIVGPEGGPVRTLYIIQRGLVDARRPEAPPGAAGIEYAPGEIFPLNAVLGARASRGRYVATEDVFCYEIDAETVEELLRVSAPFQRFCTRQMDTLLQQARDLLRMAYSAEMVSDRPLMRPLGTALKRAPVTCHVDAPLRDALETMGKQRVAAVVAVDGGGAPRGIFTERDLLRHTVSGRIDVARPLHEFMTPDPISLPTAATLYDAALVMARHNIRHLLVSDNGKLAGVVSERSLFALQRRSMREVVTAIDLAEDLTGLQAAAAEIRALARDMLAQGVGAEPLTSFVATLNDRLTERILLLESARHDLRGIRFCWLALGSEGRHEQTFSTDQDNALIFVDNGGGAEALRARLLPFARAVNATLDACGFPLCRGEIMAGNAKWCLSTLEWRERFGDWIRNPHPEALLNSSIFFDFRALWGEAQLAHDLRAWLTAMTRDDQRFLRMMAQNALQSEPPLGFFGEFQTSGKGEQRGTIDLKSQGTRVFTDAARIVALSIGADVQNTAARLRQAGVHDKVPSEEVEAVVDGFYFILLLRLRHQHLEKTDGTGSNRINPRTLHELDQRILKEAFRQGRKIQKRLALDYQLR